MKTLLMIVAILFASPLFSQSRKTTQKTVPINVSLDEILSCTDDAIIQKVFETNLGTMRTIGDNPSLGFESVSESLIGSGGPLSFLVVRHHLAGVISEPYCKMFTVQYPEDKAEALPDVVNLPGSPLYAFNPNDLFVHANQFTFQSAVGEDSSITYFIANKGRVFIRFVPESTGLTFDRALIIRQLPIGGATQPR